MAHVLVRIHQQDQTHLRGVHTWRGVKFSVDNGSPGNWYRLPVNTDAEKQFVEELKFFRQDDSDPKSALVFEVAQPDEVEEDAKPKEAPGTLKSAVREIEGKPPEREVEKATPPQPPAAAPAPARGRRPAAAKDDE